MLFVIRKIADKEKVISYLNRLPITERGYKLLISRITKSRSLSQNKYYWKVIIGMLADEWGWDQPERLHDALRIKFLSVNTEKLPTVKSTTELTTVQFEEYTSKIRQWASEEGICIPLPNEILLDE